MLIPGMASRLQRLRISLRIRPVDRYRQRIRCALRRFALSAWRLALAMPPRWPLVLLLAVLFSKFDRSTVIGLMADAAAENIIRNQLEINAPLMPPPSFRR